MDSPDLDPEALASALAPPRNRGIASQGLGGVLGGQWQGTSSNVMWGQRPSNANYASLSKVRQG